MRVVRSTLGGALAVAVLAGLVAVVAAPLGASAAGAANPYPRDGKLTLSDVQLLGTHNSYHLRPDREVAPTEPANYEHPQLEGQGIRSLEIDAYNGPDLPVFHSLIVDDRSTCPTLAACLDTVATWSKARPGHVPLVLYVEPKALPTNTNPDIQAAIDTVAAEQGLTNWDAAGLERIDTAVREAFAKTLLTPDQVRKKRPTLRDAVRKDGWPTLGATRGKVLVVLNVRDALLDAYLDGAPSLEGRAMFVPSTVSDPYAAFIKRDRPTPVATMRLVERNFLVGSRADADGIEARANDQTRAEAALSSGAQVVVTDYPVADPLVGPYLVALPGTAVARCNPVRAPTSCRDTDIENPRGLRNPKG
ncbi:MAG: Ca2+-dependent phosphoinositide-specific phospholipase C [Acidimicrobiia bacterium]